jgi:hydrogenase maturation protease
MVAGLGNVFMGDDGFGCEVVRRLQERAQPPAVRVEDYGIRGMHLALDLLDGYDELIVVDALDGDEAPGTLRVVEPAAVADDAGRGAHEISVEAVLSLVRRYGGNIERVVVVGCQPESLAPAMGLSDAVRAAVEPAVRMVESLVEANRPCA